MSRVDFGRWKLVTRLSITLNSYPGYMNIPVEPAPARTYYFPSSPLKAADSTVLVDVVPTETILPPLFMHLLIISAFFSYGDAMLII